MATGKITLGSKATAGHKATLESKGYSCSIAKEMVGKEEKDVLSVECSGLIDRETIDLTTPAGVERVKAAVAAKQLFTYNTKFKIPGAGDTAFSGIYACRRLGALSAFIARDSAAVAAKKPAVSAVMSSLLDSIL